MDDPDFIKICKMTDTMIIYRNPQDVGKDLIKVNEEIGTLIRKLGLTEK